jgi:hypothetical protein
MLLFGQSHQMGGSLQDLFFSGALAAGVGFLVLFVSLAVAGAAHDMGGSVLAARLMRYLPGLGSLAGATAMWYTAIEAAETQHGGLPWPVVALAVASAAILVFFSARSAVRAIARITIAITGPAPLLRARRPLHLATSHTEPLAKAGSQPTGASLVRLLRGSHNLTRATRAHPCEPFRRRLPCVILSQCCA